MKPPEITEFEGVTFSNAATGCGEAKANGAGIYVLRCRPSEGISVDVLDDARNPATKGQPSVIAVQRTDLKAKRGDEVLANVDTLRMQLLKKYGTATGDVRFCNAARTNCFDAIVGAIREPLFGLYPLALLTRKDK